MCTGFIVEDNATDSREKSDRVIYHTTTTLFHLNQRTNDGRMLFCFSANRSWLYRALCSGGVDPDDPYNPIDNPEHGCMSWFRDYLAVALNCRPVKVIVILIFACYLAGALYGLTTLQEGLDRRKLSKNDSYSITFYDRQDYYFREFPYRIQVDRIQAIVI